MNKMINCKTCGKEIAASAKVCPSCGAKNKPPIYKRVWFWVLIVFFVVPMIVIIKEGGNSTNNTSRNDSSSETDRKSVV